MATASNLSGVKYDPGEEVSPLTAGAPSKSFVVGKYDEFGRKRKAGETVGGTSEAVRLSRLLNGSMSTRGGQLLPGFVMTPDGPVKTSQAPRIAPMAPKRGQAKTKKVKHPIQLTPTIAEHSIQEYQVQGDQQPIQVQATPEPEEKPKFTVVFSIESGTIRSMVDAVIEDALALILVYPDNEHISYIPQKGNKLVIKLPDNRKLEAMYLGSQLQWYDSEQQLLVFMKTQPEGE